MATRTLYTGRDSCIKYQLLDAGIAQDLTNLSKIELIFSSTVKVVGTVGTTAPLDFATIPTEMVLRFASVTLASGSYPNVKVIVYDTENPNGLIWGTIPLVVKDNPYTS